MYKAIANGSQDVPIIGQIIQQLHQDIQNVNFLLVLPKATDVPRLSPELILSAL